MRKSISAHSNARKDIDLLSSQHLQKCVSFVRLFHLESMRGKIKLSADNGAGFLRSPHNLARITDAESQEMSPDTGNASLIHERCAAQVFLDTSDSKEVSVLHMCSPNHTDVKDTIYVRNKRK